MTASPTALAAPPRPDLAAIRLGARIEVASAALGRAVRLDWPAVVRQRADLEGLRVVPGTVSTGGASHLLRCADGWCAVSLARPDDLDALPAWLALAGVPGLGAAAPRTIEAITPLVARASGAALADAAALVGLPVGILGERRPDGTTGVVVTDHGPAALDRPMRVLDLSVLWAGPLCTHLLGLAGASVTKVTSATRPDPSRTGNPTLFAHLDRADRHVALDLTRPGDSDALARLIREADVVVESARPRALEQLGINASSELDRAGGPTVWTSITGHGRSSPRVGFGDDAAVAGGLVAWSADGPLFAGDALADPLTGLAAAAATLEALAAGRRALVDAALAGIAASASEVC